MNGCTSCWVIESGLHDLTESRPPGNRQGVLTVIGDRKAGQSYLLGPGRHIGILVIDGALSFGLSIRELRCGKVQPAAAVDPDQLHGVAPQPIGDSNGDTTLEIPV